MHDCPTIWFVLLLTFEAYKLQCLKSVVIVTISYRFVSGFFFVLKMNGTEMKTHYNWHMNWNLKSIVWMENRFDNKVLKQLN